MRLLSVGAALLIVGVPLIIGGITGDSITASMCRGFGVVFVLSGFVMAITGRVKA